MIIPGVFEDMQGMKAGDTVKLQIAVQNDFTWRTTIRGLVNQVPGQQFTDYTTTAIMYLALGGLPVMVPTTDFKDIMNEYWLQFPERKEAFYNKTADYEFVDGIPKQKCFIKLNPDITEEQ